MSLMFLIVTSREFGQSFSRFKILILSQISGHRSPLDKKSFVLWLNPDVGNCSWFLLTVSQESHFNFRVPLVPVSSLASVICFLYNTILTEMK